MIERETRKIIKSEFKQQQQQQAQNMEFRFNINKIFKNNISRIGNSLLPVGFVAVDRRTAL